MKFLRLAEHYVERNGRGIVAFINPHGFLDNPTFRGMRWNLLKTFDEIYVLNLHGNAKKKETCPDGSKDENVFDIMQGVSINIFVKGGTRSVASITNIQTGLTGFTGLGPTALTQRTQSSQSSAKDSLRSSADSAFSVSAPAGKNSNPVSPVTPVEKENFARVHYADLYGTHEAKYAFLESHSLDTTPWQELELREPYYFFVPKDFSLEEEYKKGFAVDVLMPVYNSGIQTKRDGLVISFDEQRVGQVLSDFKALNCDEIVRKYELPGDGRDWQVALAKNDVVSHNPILTPILYRPLDLRWTAYTDVSKGFMAYPRAAVFGSMVGKENYGLLVRRSTPDLPFRYVSVCSTPISEGVLGIDPNGRESVFPLYLYTEKDGVVEKKANLNSEIVAKIAECLKTGLTGSGVGANETVLRVTHAQGCAREVTSTAQPPTSNLQPHDAFETNASTGRVYVNKAQYFDNVPQSAWEFFIGGYQPAQKWLKDRKGRVLSPDDIVRYKSIILALLETRRLMDAADAASSSS